MEAKAALVDSPGGPFVIRDVSVADPKAGEILVRITAAGICHTDLVTKSIWPESMSPMIFGHEGAGIVQAIGEGVTSVAVGDSVCLSYRSCGSCGSCSEDEESYCTKFRQLNMSGGRGDGTSAVSDGGKVVYSGYFGQSSFATYAISYETNTVKVPADIPAVVAAPLGCSVQTGAGTVLNVLVPKTGDSFALFGAGAVGLAAVMAAASAGCTPIVVVDPIAERRTIAKDLGATHTIDPTKLEDVAETIRHITAGGAHTALDTSAVPVVINQAIAALRPRGVCALVGIGVSDLSLNATQLIAGGITVRGVIEGDATPSDFIPRLVEMYRQGRLPIEKLISEYKFTEIEAAATDAAAGRVIKPILTFD